MVKVTVPSGADADPSIRLELSRRVFFRRVFLRSSFFAGSFFAAKEPLLVERDDERRAPERGCLEKGAARSDHGFFLVRSAVAAFRIALRMRG